MDEFLNKLYNYEYFGTYLMISIAVLVLLFIIILVFGKKDQKNREIEATKKLQQISPDDIGSANAFAETSVPNNLEVGVPPVMENSLNQPMPNVPENSTLEPNLENNTVIVPTIDSVNIPNEVPVVDPVLPNTVPTEPLEVNNSIDNLSNSTNEYINPFASSSLQEPVQPVLEKTAEKPFSFSNVDLEPVTSVEPIAPERQEPVINEEPQIEVPTFNFADIVGQADTPVEPVAKPKEVFSSVYTPEEKKETPEVEMPTPKKDDDIELPTLKKDTENIEKPVLNDYNLNDLSGESYNINR